MSVICKSYVLHEDKCFFVSTINRDSSAAEHVGQYAETMVWEYDWATAIRGKILFQGDGPRDSIREHLRVVESLHERGTVE